MASANFEAALARVLAHEGGYTNHPSDPGGPTNFGITIADFRKFVKPGATVVDVRSMSLEDAKKIYRSAYWQTLRCDELPSGVDYAVFDYGVNSGTGRATKILRRLLRLPVKNDPLDDAVVAAAAATDANRLISAICDERLAFLQSLKTWPVFGAGWSRRVAEVRTVALEMVKARQSVSPSVPVRKAVIAGTVVAAGAVAQGAGVSPSAIALAIVVILLVGTVCWLLWRKFKRH